MHHNVHIFSTTLSLLFFFTLFIQIIASDSFTKDGSKCSASYLLLSLSAILWHIKVGSLQITRIWHAKLVWAWLDYPFSCSCAYLWHNKKCQKFPNKLELLWSGWLFFKQSSLPLLEARNETDVSIKNVFQTKLLVCRAEILQSFVWEHEKVKWTGWFRV